LIHPYNKNANQNGREKVKLNLKCLVLVKIIGNSPKKLLSIINKNIEEKIIIDLLLNLLFKIILNSLYKLFKILINLILILLEIIQNGKGNINNKEIVLNQFIDKSKILVVGSNEENKLVIIFRGVLLIF